MIYTVFLDSNELPQDFASYEEAEEYGKERVAWGYAKDYTIESTDGNLI